MTGTVAGPASTWFAGTAAYRDPVGALRIALFADILGRFTPGRLVDLGARVFVASEVVQVLGFLVGGVVGLFGVVVAGAVRFDRHVGLLWCSARRKPCAHG